MVFWRLRRNEEGQGCLLFIFIIIAVFFAVPWLITLAWGWVIPDIFAGAVEQGILPAEITMVQALKLSILLSIIWVSLWLV